MLELRRCDRVEERDNDRNISRPKTGTAKRAQTGRPESSAARKSQTGRPESSAAKRAQTGRPKSSAAGRAQTGRPEGSTAKRTSGTGTSAASSRPRSASAEARTRTSTGRPLDKSTATRSDAARRAGTAQSEQRRKNSKSAGSGSRTSAQTTRRRKKKKQYNISNKTVLIAALIIGVALALIVSAAMRAGMLKVKQIKTDYEIGTTFSINSYFEADSNDATLTLDKSDFNPQELGKYKVKYTITRGKLSKKKKGTINVVDTTRPYIDGEEEIDVGVGETINWSDYYGVSDEDPDIQSKLEASLDIDTSEPGSYVVTLSATDWADNTSSKTVTVNVVKSNFEE